MPYDAYIQVAPDASGKKVDMDQVASAAGAVIYRQRAVLVGESGNILQQLLETNRQILFVLQAILGNQQMLEPTFGTDTHELLNESNFSSEV